MDKLQSLYFRSSPPSVSTGDKKFEFPDAIALLSLERWAAEGDRRVLAVSADKGWLAYGEGSERIDVVADLAKAIETLQEHTDAAEKAISGFMDAVAAGHFPDAEADIKARLKASFASWAFDAEGSSSLHFSVNGGTLNLLPTSFGRLTTSPTSPLFGWARSLRWRALER